MYTKSYKTTIALTGAEIAVLRVLLRIGGDDFASICEANDIAPNYDLLAMKLDMAMDLDDDE